VVLKKYAASFISAVIKHVVILWVFVIALVLIAPTALCQDDAGDEASGPSTIDIISGLLDDDTAILVYNADSMKVLVITSGGTATRTLPKADEPLEIRVKAFVESMEALDPLVNFQDEAYALYQILIEPVEGDIAGFGRLGIVPGFTLRKLSFAALVSDRDEANDFMPRPRFLMDDYAVFYSPALSLLADSLALPASTNLGGLVLGNAPYPGGFSYLKVAPLEMKAVTAEIPGAVMYETESATESLFWDELAKGGLSVVHITSHSVIKSGNNESSRILLAGGDGQDGNLTVDEVLYSDMDVSLVTLSADRAALIWSGSGGFPGAFLLAGADSVLAPIWTIDRGVTAVFMEFFYGNLTDHDKAEALRLAQQMVIDSEVEKGYRRLAHPGYWAPFVLYGSCK